MNTTSLSIEKLIEYFGNQSELARRLGIKPQSIQEWVSTNHLPIRRALQIERITEGEIPFSAIVHLTGVEKETPTPISPAIPPPIPEIPEREKLLAMRTEPTRTRARRTRERRTVERRTREKRRTDD